MSKVYFLFGIHNHQPVGNDPFVFNKTFEDCYRPFLDVLKEFPEIKCNIHISGPLYDWILKNKPDYIKDLKKMVGKKQIEITGGAYYEPILPIISDKDKFAQIRLMNDFIKKEFGKAPLGMWLAERIWEPQLASIISKAGLKYTFLDDVHFRSAGICDKELTGYYTTENDARSIAVFPINKTLRFKIPFSKAEESVALIKSFSQNKDILVTLFDDGEKFGSWPMTYDWIYNKGWLKKFFSLLWNRKNFHIIKNLKTA
jgi:alpha-amylase